MQIQERNIQNQPHVAYPHACVWYFREKMTHYHVHIRRESWNVYICNNKYETISAAALPLHAVLNQRIKRSYLLGCSIIQ